jgi:hypothetical protein
VLTSTVPRRTSRETSRCRTAASIDTGAMETLPHRRNNVGGGGAQRRWILEEEDEMRTRLVLKEAGGTDAQ